MYSSFFLWFIFDLKTSTDFSENSVLSLYMSWSKGERFIIKITHRWQNYKAADIGFIFELKKKKVNQKSVGHD